MQNHAVELARAGVRVSAHGMEDADTADDRAGWGPVAFHAHPARLSRIAYAPGLAAGLAMERPDIVHLHGIWQYPSLVADRWRRRTGGPVVVSTQGMLEPWALANARAKKRIAEAFFERRNLSRAAVLHCSRAEVAGVRAFGLSNPIAVLPNGAAIPESAPGLMPPQFMSGPKRTLLFLGRLHPKKGISETLAAWARLAAEHSAVADSWHLVIAGWDDGGYEARFRAEAVALGLGDRVVFPGPLFGEVKEAALANADAFVLASHSEGFPMAVMEAWAHALPVFMTRGCNIPEGFDEGAAVEVGTEPGALAEVLGRHLMREDLADMGRRGLAMVRQRFSWPAIASELVGVYRWVLGRQERPACIDLP
jgi:poly(glycerol-phosphate) alpha-glucosyltransferase